LDLGGFNGAPNGVMDISGGTLNDSAWLIVSRGTGGTGLLNMTGGTVNFTGTTANQLILNYNASATEAAVINVANANFTATNATGGILDLMKSGTAGQRGTVNLLSSGVIQVQGVKATNTTGTSNFNFNGGTLKASTANASFLTGLTAATVYSGGGTIDNNGVAITVGQALQAPAGFGVSDSTISVPSGGSGYVGAPIVTLSGGTGSGATGYATISGGVVTGIVITSPGTGYTSGDTLTATFSGGGAAAVQASSVTGITVAANTSGGMTFANSGTTTLSGANTYSGGTTVSGGALTVSGASAKLGTGNVSVLGTATTLTISTGVTNAIADTATVSLAGDVTHNGIADFGYLTLQSGVNETVATLFLNNVLQAGGTYGATGSGATNVNDEYFSGSGVLTVVPEPTSLGFLGLAAAVGLRRRRPKC
jgi:autotransporter-associated beta strand protein